MSDSPERPSRPSHPSRPSRPSSPAGPAGKRTSRPSHTSSPRIPSSPRLSPIARLSAVGIAARGTVAPAVAAFRDPARLTARLWIRALRIDRRARTGMAVLVGLFLIAIAGAVSPPLLGRPEEALQAPSTIHPFGTDALGRDVMMAIFQGASPTLLGGLGAALAASMIGMALGALSGFLRGPFDVVVHRAIEAVSAVPSLLLVLLLQALSPVPGPITLLLAVIATRWAEIARTVRTDVLRVVQLDHVAAARALGASPSRVLARHILPDALSSALVLAAFAVGSVVMIETAVAAVGIGTPDPLAWGTLLGQVRTTPRAWWLVVFPAFFVMLAVAATSLLGESMRDALDPRLRTWEGKTPPRTAPRPSA